MSKVLPKKLLTPGAGRSGIWKATSALGPQEEDEDMLWPVVKEERPDACFWPLTALSTLSRMVSGILLATPSFVGPRFLAGLP